MGRWRQFVDLSHCFLSVLACQCVGAGYTITLKKSNVKKVTDPREKFLLNQISWEFTLITNYCGGVQVNLTSGTKTTVPILSNRGKHALLVSKRNPYK